MGRSGESAREFTPFEGEAIRVLQEVQDSLATLLNEARLDPAVGPTRLGRALAIDTKLAWKATNLLAADDPFAAGAYLPGRAAAAQLLEAAGRRGAGEGSRQRARDALAAVDELARTHAGNRRTLELLLAGCADRGQSKVGLEQRKSAFHAGSYIWGLRAAVQYQTFVYHPSAREDRVDVALLAGTIALHQMRPGVAWRVIRHGVGDGAEPEEAGGDREPLDRSAADAELPFLTEFCTQPLPRCRPIALPSGRSHVQLLVDEVGSACAVDVVTGEVLRGVSARHSHGACHENVATTHVRTPCELLVVDLIVHRSLSRDAEPRASLIGDLYHGDGEPGRAASSSGLSMETERLPFHGGLEALEPRRRTLHLREVPRYGEMLTASLDRLGWDRTQFAVWRLRMQYPPLPTSVVLAQDLPEPPTVPSR